LAVLQKHAPVVLHADVAVAAALDRRGGQGAAAADNYFVFEVTKVIQAKADKYADRVGPIVRDIIRKTGADTMRDIAAALEARGVATPRGNTNWGPTQVSNLLKRIK
jgi:hypothetical protein